MTELALTHRPSAVSCLETVLLVIARRHHLNYWDLLDAGVLFAAVGQPIGRLGNVMNGEILGPPSNLPWAIRYTNPASMAPQLGVAYQPANLYEAVGTLIILVRRMPSAEDRRVAQLRLTAEGERRLASSFGDLQSERSALLAAVSRLGPPERAAAGLNG